MAMMFEGQLGHKEGMFVFVPLEEVHSIAIRLTNIGEMPIEITGADVSLDPNGSCDFDFSVKGGTGRC